MEDGRELLPQYGEMFDGLVDGVVVDIIGGWLGPQQEVIADVLLDEAMAVVTTNDRVGQSEVFKYGLQFSAVLFGDLPLGARRPIPPSTAHDLGTTVFWRPRPRGKRTLA